VQARSFQRQSGLGRQQSDPPLAERRLTNGFNTEHCTPSASPNGGDGGRPRVAGPGAAAAEIGW
jgi:hypothetical protein